jgi:iron complex transport system ATP-binding protein
VVAEETAPKGVRFIVVIAAKNLRYTYPGGIEALKGISVKFESGTITGIIGPNGSGKSTLIKCLANIQSTDSGQVMMDGSSLKSLSHRERAREMAYVPQDTYIPFSFTALEVVLMGRAPYLGTFAFETEVDLGIAKSAMRETGTEGFASRYIQELSGGERQRVVLARALAQDPKVMFLDEPTASLDIHHSIEFYEVLRQRCREKNLSVVAAMHDLNLASLFCQKLILLFDGEVAAFGPPSEVMTGVRLSEVFGTPISVLDVKYTPNPIVLPILS